MLASVPENRITSSDVVELLAEYRNQVKTQKENIFKNNICMKLLFGLVEESCATWQHVGN
jgi:hypothetical protein